MKNVIVFFGENAIIFCYDVKYLTHKFAVDLYYSVYHRKSFIMFVYIFFLKLYTYLKLNVTNENDSDECEFVRLVVK